MPAQSYKRRGGLKRGTGRGGIPHPGEGGYDYPRGPYGATGYPGSTPAALGRIPHAQTEQGRRDRQLTATAAQDRDTNPRYIRPDGSPRQPRARQMRSTSPERRMTPLTGALGPAGHKPPRNQVAQRYKAVPGQVRSYRPAANPGKTGAHLAGPSALHPGTTVYGDPDGTPIPGMAPAPGWPPEVTVVSRFVSGEGAQEGYAVNRPPEFAKGGVAGFPPGYDGNRHLRGARLTGQRYFGALAEQQRIGLPSDSYGISRARGPRHRPVRFEQPAPWTANYYDVAPEHGRTSPDMIHRSPTSARRPRGRSPRRG